MVNQTVNANLAGRVQTVRQVEFFLYVYYVIDVFQPVEILNEIDSMLYEVNFMEK